VYFQQTLHSTKQIQTFVNATVAFFFFFTLMLDALGPYTQHIALYTTQAICWQVLPYLLNLKLNLISIE
jgi:hypothetical protein